MMQQEDVARCAALLDGISSLDSIPDQICTTMLDTSPAKQLLQPAANHTTSAASLKMWSPEQARQAPKPELEPRLTGQSGSDMAEVSLLQASNMKLGTDAFLPGPGGVAFDVRTLRVEPDFSPFAAGIGGYASVLGCFGMLL